MNLKDRLVNVKKINVSPFKEAVNVNNQIMIDDIFDVEENVQIIIQNLIKNNKNIILIGNNSIDKQIAANYISYNLKDYNTVTVNILEEIVLNSVPKIYIFPKPKIEEIVKIFEYNIQGYKPFIFGLDLNNFDNVIEKIKALIAVNYKNITDRVIDILLSESEPVLVFITKNEDGLYIISQINELKYTDSGFQMEVLFEAEKKEVYTEEHLPQELKFDFEMNNTTKEEINEQEEVSTFHEDEEINDNEFDSEIEYTDNSDTGDIVNTEITEQHYVEDTLPEKENATLNEEIIQDEETTIDKEETIQAEQVDTSSKKINKYKLLKEKVKNKKMSNKDNI